MRILHVIASMTGGGAERQLCYLAAAQVEQGLDVHVAFLFDGPNLPRLERSGATIERLSAMNQYDLRLISRLKSMISRVKPDIVQAWGTPYDVYCALACGRRVPWILCERSTGAWNPRCHGFVSNLFRLALAPRAAAVIANAKAPLTTWKRPKMKDVLLRTIPNAIPLDEIDAAAKTPHPAEGEQASWPVLIAAGRYTFEKNYPTFVEALKLLKETHDVCTVICGRDPKGDLRTLVEKANLTERVVLPGHVDDVWSRMKQATAFVSLSLQEGMPNVVLEAAACECPLILSDIPEHREIVDDSQAIFVPVNDPKAVAEVIADVLDDAQKRQIRADAARKAIQSLDAQTMASAYKEVYDQILGS